MPEDFADTRFGAPTVRDILKELEKPGRDPRPEFRTAAFKEDVTALTDLQPGMVLEGVVTNVANFGAFVDIGVHQDGLVHVSQLADRFVQDPRDVVKAGQIVRVRVVEVDLKRKRIALTMRAGCAESPQGQRMAEARQSRRCAEAPQGRRCAEPRQSRRCAEARPGRAAGDVDGRRVCAAQG